MKTVYYFVVPKHNLVVNKRLTKKKKSVKNLSVNIYLLFYKFNIKLVLKCLTCIKTQQYMRLCAQLYPFVANMFIHR